MDESDGGGLRKSILDFEAWISERRLMTHELSQRMPKDSYLPTVSR